MASLTLLFETNDNSLRMGAMIRVSTGGLISIILNPTKMTGPSNSGAVSSFIIPSNPKVIEIANEGIRLINPARRT